MFSSSLLLSAVVQPPTVVSLAATGKSTARVTWSSVSKVLLYQVTVTDSDNSNPPVIRNTSSTSMDISNLEPCSNYTVGVSSVNVFLVPGEPTNVYHSTSSKSFIGGILPLSWLDTDTVTLSAELTKSDTVQGCSCRGHMTLILWKPFHCLTGMCFYILSDKT